MLGRGGKVICKKLFEDFREKGKKERKKDHREGLEMPTVTPDNTHQYQTTRPLNIEGRGINTD